MALLERSDLEQISLILAISDKHKGAKVLTALPEKIRPQIVVWACHLVSNPPASLLRVKDSVKIDLTNLLGLEQDTQHLAEVISLIPVAEAEKLLQQLSMLDETLARWLADQIFFFEDIVNMPDYPLQVCLFEFGRHGIGLSDVACALWGASTELKSKFLRNISKGRAQVIETEMSYLTEVLPETIADARQKCAALIGGFAADKGLILPRLNGDSILWAGTLGQLPEPLQQVLDQKLERLAGLGQANLQKLFLEIPHSVLVRSLVAAKPAVKQKLLSYCPRAAQRQFEDLEPLTLRNGIYSKQIVEALGELDLLAQELLGK